MQIKRIIILAWLIFASSCTFAQNLIPVDTLMKKVRSAAEKYNEWVQTYDAEVYMRTYVETVKKNFLYKFTRFVPRFVLHDPESDEAIIETISRLHYTYPYNYTHYIQYVTGSLTKKKDIEMLPLNILNINIYAETTYDESFLLPLRDAASKYYTYRIKQTYYDQSEDKTYYTVDFTPIYTCSKLLKGIVVIEEGTWRAIRFTAEWIELMNDFQFEITMGNDPLTAYLPVNFTIYKTTSYLGNVVTNRCLAQIDYTDIVLNDHTLKEKNLDITSLYGTNESPPTIHNDSVFWEKIRPIPLQAKETETIENYKKQQNGDSLFNHQKAQQIAKLMTEDSQYRYKSTQIRYSGPLNPSSLGYTSLDGLTYRQKLFMKVDLKDDKDLYFDAFAGYVFKRKEFIADLSARWNYNPARIGNLSFSVGSGNRTYSSRFVKQVQDSLLDKGLKISDISVDYYKDYYLRLFNEMELTNGLMLGGGIEYHIRKGNGNTTAVKTSNAENNGVDEMFGKQYDFSPFIRLSWTPQQYYRFNGPQKIPVRSDYPTFKIEFARSIKNILGSSSEYNRLEIDISQNIPLGLMKSFQYHVGGGIFTDQKTEYFADFVYFAKNNFPQNWDVGLGGTFNLLNRELYNASDSYFQAHLMFETPFLTLKNVPPISHGILTERLYLGQLYTPQIISYTELGYGIGNRLFNAAVFGSFHKYNFHEVGIRMLLTF